MGRPPTEEGERDGVTLDLSEDTAPRLSWREGSDVGALLSAMVEALPDCTMLVDDQHRILATNAALRDWLGAAAGELVGRRCHEVMHHTGQPIPGCYLRRCLEAGRPVSDQCEDVDTGRILLAGVNPTSLKTADGRRIYLHFARDVTAESRVAARAMRTLDAQRLINSMARLALLPFGLDDVLEHAITWITEVPWLSAKPRAAIFLVDDASGRLVMKAQHGLEECIRDTCAEVKPGVCLCGRAALTGKVQFSDRVGDDHDITFNGVEPHGHYCVPIIHCEATLGVLNVAVDEGHMRDEDELEFLSAAADVLAGIIHHRQVEALRRRNEQIAVSRERLARLGELSAGVAHTVRNPLHGVLAGLRILEGEAKREAARSLEVIDHMRDGLERIDKVTRRLLALTRDSAAPRHQAQLADVLGDALSLAAAHAEERNIALRLESEDALEVVMDVDRVVEALVCVISNAVDASQPEQVVTTRVRIDGSASLALVIEVEDDGCGIAEANLPRVQDPFFTTKPIGEGSGLGLAIARRIMEEHQGEIAIHSLPGAGTRVQLAFPGSVVVSAP